MRDVRSGTMVALALAALWSGCSDDDTTPPPGSDMAVPMNGVDMAHGGGGAGGSGGTSGGGGNGGSMGGEDGGVHATVAVQVLAFNDFHGNLGPPDVFNGSVLAPDGDPQAKNGTPIGMGLRSVLAGGASYLSAHLQALRAQNANSITVSVGDLTGASPLLASAYEDEPAVTIMNTIGLSVNAVGNHEFDNGQSELLRLQYGGCGAARPSLGAVSCATDMGFSGANFEYLAANVEYKPGLTVFPRYTIRTVGGEQIAFIGMTLKDTASIVSAAAVKGLTFDDEVTTVNALVPELKKQGVSAIIVLVHQGNSPPSSTTYSDCGSDAGPVGDMAKAMDPAVDAILSAHTHRAYSCVVNGKIVTSAASYGRVITDLELSIDTVTHSVVGKSAKQRIVTRDITPDPAVDAIVNQYLALTRDVADQVEGYSPVDITSYTDAASSQSPMGAIIADSMLASVPGAQVAFMNVGGVRDGVQAAKLYPTDSRTSDGIITYEKLKTVQPFGNRVVKGMVSGSDLKLLLEQQFLNQPYPKVLQVAGISFHYSQSAPAGSKISQIKLVSGGTSTDVDITSTTRNITMVTNDFLGISGGDGFVQFKNITPPFADTGLIDLNALAAYTKAQSHPPDPSHSDPGAALVIPSAQGRVFVDP